MMRSELAHGSVERGAQHATRDAHATRVDAGTSPADTPRAHTMSWPRLGAVLLVGGFLVAHSVGCTVLFPLIESAGAPEKAGGIVPAEELFEVGAGARLRLSDGDTVWAEGTFRGLALDADSAYAGRFATFGEARERLGLPALDEAVRIAPVSSRRQVTLSTGRFGGFDYRGVRVKNAEGRVSRCAMTEIDSMWRADGRGLSGRDLLHLDADRRLPSRTVLRVTQSGHGADGVRVEREVRVPWDRAVRVERAGEGRHMVAAVVMGLLVDGFVVWQLTRPPAKQTAPTGCEDTHILSPMARLEHVRRAEHDFDRVAGEYVLPEATLATR